MITNEKLVELLISSGADVDADAIRADTTFADLGLDSVDVFSFFSEIDIELGVDIPDKDLDQLHTIEQISSYLNAK